MIKRDEILDMMIGAVHKCVPSQDAISDMENDEVIGLEDFTDEQKRIWFCALVADTLNTAYGISVESAGLANAPNRLPHRKYKIGGQHD